ncbi:MAG: SpoIIE family protein phosphatase, partial [Planctomycetota bacterium]
DGVLEARNAGGELFGEDRLEATLGGGGAGDRSAAQTVEEILAAVHSFRGEQPVADDITLMAIRYLGGGG